MQRYFGKSKIGNNIYINEEDFNHIKKVMRMKENDEVSVVYNNIAYLCKLNKDLESVTIIKEIDNNINSLNVSLIVPILPEEKMSLIIEKATELGVKEIIPVNMFRCKFKINKEKEEKENIKVAKDS